MAKEVRVKAEGTKTQAVSVKSRFNKLDGDRSAMLQRGRDCAALTIPSLLPPSGHKEVAPLPTPFQGMGARGLNNLASKLLIALLPPNSPFFQMSLDDFTLEKLTGKEGMRAEVEKALGKVERAVMTRIETKAYRVPCFAALKFLIGTGNALLYLPDSGGMKVYRLDQYVVKRDPVGNVIEIITQELVNPVALPEEIKQLTKVGVDTDEPVELYTHIKRDATLWNVKQEINGKILPGSEGTYPLDECPWIPLRWTAISGEDYGRGLVEEYLGDLRSLEALTKAIVEGSAAAAKLLYLVNPNGTTRMKDVSDAPSGAVKPGNSADVTVVQQDKYNDFRVALETIQRIEQRLSYAFLLMTSIQRSGERVTAEEIRTLSSELEDALGGVYSVLSQELQLPLVKRIMAQMKKAGELPELPKTVQPMITTGLEALGRGHDLNKLKTFMELLTPFGDQAFARLDVGDLVTRIGTSLGIDMGGLVKGEEQMMMEQQQAQEAQMMNAMNQSIPGAVNQLAKGTMDGINQGTIDPSQLQGVMNGEST